MAQFNGMVVTNKGRELLARALASKGKFIITAAALGDGAYSGNLRECEELVNKKLDLILMGVYSEKGSTKITVGITNKNVSESFRTNEIGVYAKLEGDAEPVLYAYDVAVEADTMPNNSLGTTLELVYDIYFDVSSEVEVTLEITDSIAFLTQDIAKREFLKTYIVSGGDLKGKVQLEADKQYLADDGKWYQNIGGDRVWTAGNGVPDSLFKEISWKEINKDISENKSLILGNTGTTAIKYIQNQGSKTSGEIYWDKDVNPIVPYYCLADTESNVVTSDFVMVSNKALIKKNQRDENISLLKSNIKGTGTTYIPEFPNFRYGFITWSISTSPSSITHDHYTAFFDTRLGYVWNTQQHILGAIRVGVSGNSLSITGVGGQYVTIISVYGIGLK